MELLHALALAAVFGGSTMASVCSKEPCLNGGTCFDVPIQNEFACLCPKEWTGKVCNVKNPCTNNPCRNGGTCFLNESYTAKCHCLPGFLGRHCQKLCPPDFCHNGGTCLLNKHGNFSCKCQSDFSGQQCEFLEDKCRIRNPCRNGGTCVQKLGTNVTCKCPVGFTGDKCHRPCRDVYKSCSLWESENRCDWARHITGFFDINCAQSCRVCTSDSKIDESKPMLPPILEPFAFMIGRWRTRVPNNASYPINFASADNGYDEVINFQITEPTMFGTPSINYSSISVNLLDMKDVVSSTGFLTLKPGSRPLKTFLMMTDNNGVSSIEEGVLEDRIMLNEMKYIMSLPDMDNKLPKMSQRAFQAIDNGDSLQQSILKTSREGDTINYEKIYTKF